MSIVVAVTDVADLTGTQGPLKQVRAIKRQWKKTWPVSFNRNKPKGERNLSYSDHARWSGVEGAWVELQQRAANIGLVTELHAVQAETVRLLLTENVPLHGVFATLECSGIVETQALEQLKAVMAKAADPFCDDHLTNDMDSLRESMQRTLPAQSGLWVVFEHVSTSLKMCFYVAQQARCAFGRNNERCVVDLLNSNVWRFNPMLQGDEGGQYIQKAVTRGTVVCLLKGRLDGRLQDGTPVEIKNRTRPVESRDMDIRELIQVQTYMHLLDCRELVFVEASWSEDGRHTHTRERSINANPALWQDLEQKLMVTLDFTQELAKNQMLAAMFMLLTEEAQIQFVKEYLPSMQAPH